MNVDYYSLSQNNNPQICQISPGFTQPRQSWVKFGTKITVRMRSRSNQPIYVVSLFYICSIQNTDDIIQTHISIWRPRAGSSKRLVK